MTARIARVRNRLGADVVLSLYALTLLVLPARYTIGSFAFSASMLVAIVAGVLWAAGFATGRRTAIPRTPAGRALLTFAVVTVVAYTVTMLQPNDVTFVSAADRKMTVTICALGAAVLAVDGLRSRAALDRVLRALVIGGGILAVIAIVQYADGWQLARLLRPPGFGTGGSEGFIFDRGGRTRVAGTMRHPIELGIVCAVLLPLGLYTTVHAADRRDRRIAAVASGLLALALPMALSRAAVLAFAAGLAVLAWLLPAERRRRLLLAAGGALAVFVVLVPNLATTLRNLFTTDLAEGSDTARAAAADVALDRYSEAPLLGTGLGGLQGVIVDNQYLVALGETGIVGLAAVVILWFGVVGSARAARRAATDEAARDLGATFLAMISAVAVASAGLATLGSGASVGLVFLLVGLAGAHHRITLTEESSSAVPATGRHEIEPHVVGTGRDLT